jgi:hypothetical protein
MKLLIGCPIYKREWIFPYWISCIENQGIDLSNIGFIFEASPDDEQTIQMLERYKKHVKSVALFDISVREDIPHFYHEEGTRQWSISKYENMVSLRNSLLKKARDIKPDYYYSLDSDILLTNNNTIKLLTSHIQSGADAVSTAMFMTPTTIMYPGVMNWHEEEQELEKAYRKESYPLGTYFKSDIIMAAKMMSPNVYNNVDYKLHPQGEDLGWCANAKKLGYNLYCASYIYTPHIMNKMMLQDFVNNGDPRSSVTYSN